MNLENRAQRFGVEGELKVLDGYDMRNFAVHTGLTGVMVCLAKIASRQKSLTCAQLRAILRAMRAAI